MRQTRTKHLLSVLNCPNTKTLRLLRGPFSQNTLATKLAIAQSTIVDWDSGKSIPSPDNLHALLTHFMTWTTDLGWPSLELLCDAAADSTVSRQPATQKEPTA